MYKNTCNTVKKHYIKVIVMKVWISILYQSQSCEVSRCCKINRTNLQVFHWNQFKLFSRLQPTFFIIIVVQYSSLRLMRSLDEWLFSVKNTTFRSPHNNPYFYLHIFTISICTISQSTIAIIFTFTFINVSTTTRTWSSIVAWATWTIIAILLIYTVCVVGAFWSTRGTFI